MTQRHVREKREQSNRIDDNRVTSELNYSPSPPKKAKQRRNIIRSDTEGSHADDAVGSSTYPFFQVDRGFHCSGTDPGADLGGDTATCSPIKP